MNLSHLQRTAVLLAACLAVSAILSACGVISRSAPPPVRSGADSPAAAWSMNRVQTELYKAHEEWEGTPYVLGGSGVNGVDCSSFIQIVFERHFGMDLPRNTRQQIRQGRGIRRGSVRPGDLIFFRTSPDVLHVGIAVNRVEFLHASTSAGVMISSLEERYWSSRYLGARRLL